MRGDSNISTKRWKPFLRSIGNFNELLFKCPYQKLSQEDQVQAFYKGLNGTNKGIVDSACGGVLMQKSSEEAMELF
jgi:hypothetical protein